MEYKEMWQQKSTTKYYKTGLYCQTYRLKSAQVSNQSQKNNLVISYRKCLENMLKVKLRGN